MSPKKMIGLSFAAAAAKGYEVFEKPAGRVLMDAPGFLYSENHSLGEWFQRSLVAMMKTKNSFCFRMSVRSANCTKSKRRSLHE